MRWSDGKTLRTLAVGAIAGAAIVAAGTALATNLVGADATSVLSACVTANGEMRLVTDGRPCAKNDTLVSWNVRGVKGDPGPAGLQGPVGPTGPQGPAGLPGGVSGLEVVTAASASGPGVTKDAEAVCPSGKKVSGGGALVTGGSNAAVTSSTPGAVSNPTSWYVQARQFIPSGDWTVYAYAVCVNTAP